MIAVWGHYLGESQTALPGLTVVWFGGAPVAGGAPPVPVPAATAGRPLDCGAAFSPDPCEQEC